MASYPPPTGDDPNYNANDFISADAAAAAGNYVLKSGDTMTGALTVPTLIATTVQTQTLDSTTVVEGDYYRILQPGAATTNSNPGVSSMILNPSSQTASGNDVVQSGDQSILYTAGSSDTGGLVIAPFSTAATESGIRMDGSGVLTQSQKTVISRNVLATAQDNSELATAGFDTIVINTKSQANSGNPAIALGDQSILFATNGVPNSADLHIGPYDATAPSGIRVTKNGNLSCYGDCDVAGALSTDTTIAAKATTNQIVLGTTTTTTINSVAPLTNKTISIPDPGLNCNFLLTQGNQTYGNNTLIMDAATNRLKLFSNPTGANVATDRLTIAASNAAGQRVSIGNLDNGRASRSTLNIRIDDPTTYARNVDIGDIPRAVMLQNIAQSSISANNGIAYGWELFPSSTNVNTARVYNNLSVKREALNGSSGYWTFAGFNSTFTGYNDYHLLGAESVQSIIHSRGATDVEATHPGISMFTQLPVTTYLPSVKCLIGSGLLSNYHTQIMGDISQGETRHFISRSYQRTVNPVLYQPTMTVNLNATHTSSFILKGTMLGNYGPSTNTPPNADVRTEKNEFEVFYRINTGASPDTNTYTVTNTPTYLGTLGTRNLNLSVVSTIGGTVSSPIITFNLQSLNASGLMHVSIICELLVDSIDDLVSYTMTASNTV